MADEAGIPSVYLEHQLSHDHKGKKNGTTLIEKLRHNKVSQGGSWGNSINSVRSAVAVSIPNNEERKTQTEVPDPSSVQNCLDKMQKAIKVLSAQTLKERLDLIGRQLGLNTDIQDKRISMGMDAFHMEMRLSDSGDVVNVKLANQGDIVDCPDLKEILKKGDFTEFVEHLQGLQSIYQVTNDEKLKSKAFIALQSLEKDLNQLAQFQSSISGVANYIHKCPLGVMLPRMAGKPMKLIYFVSPYDLLDKKSLTAHPLTVEAITDNFLGQSVKVCIEPVGESSPSNKLQTMPLMNVSKTADGKSLPSFSSWSPMNSTMLPASFVLVLPQSLPVSTHIIKKITVLTDLEIHKDSEVKNLQSLILESFSQNLKNSKRLLVSLPDQHHVYILNGLNGGSQDQGVMVSRIPFTHPTHVPKILNHLRQQLLFNIIVSSCIRPDSKKETADSIVFEVNAVSLQQLTIAFEHPAYDSLITVDIDLSDITSLKCLVSCTNPDQLMCSDETISRVFQRCMSIPVMLRSLISKGRCQLDKLKEAAIAAEKERLEKALLQKEMQQCQAKMQASILPTKSRPPPQPPHPPPLPPPPSYHHQHHSSPHMSKGQTPNNSQASHLIPSMLDESRNLIPSLEGFRNMSDSNNAHHLNNERNLLSPESEKAFNPSLTPSLDEEKGTGSSQSDASDNPMLCRLLDDNTSVTTNNIPMNCKPSHPPTTTTKRQRKRKSQSDFSGPIPKQRMSDSSNDSVDRLSNMGCSMDMDMGGVIDSTFSPAMAIGMPSMPSPHGHPAHHSMLNHSAMRSQTPGNVIDLTEEESSLKKLADSVDSLDKRFTRKDMKPDPDMTMLLYENDTPMGRIPNTIQNSPSGSKNENASTSLEGFLKGSGEVGRANNYDPVDAGYIPTSCSFSKLSSLLQAPSSDGPQMMGGGKHQMLNSNFHPDKVRSAEDSKSTPINHAVIQDIKPQIKPSNMNVLQRSSSVDVPIPSENKQIIMGVFDEFGSIKQQQQQAINIKPEVLESDPGEGRVPLKFTLKQQNNVKILTKQCNSFDESDLHLSKLDSTGTFDFKSDEDDDNPIMSRYVYSSSPTRLQISTNKQKRPESNAEVKVEKVKKKDKSSTNSAKRKREKEEARREKKRKKNEHIVSESVYRTTEKEEKSEIPKLKIRVAKKPVSDKNDKSEFSEFAEQSYEISKKLSESPRECKVLPCQPTESSGNLKVGSAKELEEDVPVPVIDLVKEKDSSSDSPLGTQKTLVQKSSLKLGGSKVSSGNVVSSKTDPKLVTKATIRLKPLTMLNSSTTISITQSAPKSAGTTTAGSMKMDRRSYSTTSLSTEKRTAGQNSTLDRRASLSGVHDRRNSHQSSSAALSLNPPVTTTAKLSLSSILPNVPTVSKIARLPRIPKLSSSSNASINRTSSLDPAVNTSQSNQNPAGSKSNNSYTAGRQNTISPSGPGPGGGRGVFGNNPISNNYNNRMAPPGSWNTRPIFPFNPNRSGGGPPRRQVSPLDDSMRPSLGNRQMGPHGNVNANAQMGGKLAKANTSNSPVLKMNNGSSNLNFNPNATQKYFAGGTKSNHNVNAQKMSNLNSNVKTCQASNNVASVQRFSGSQTHSNVNNVRSQSSITKSPNTGGINRSPNACHSPSVTGSNRSPSLNSASKSPNISGSSKSPNLNRSPSLTSSPTINRSPNINNVTRSPNIQSGSNRLSNSSSRKSPLTVPNKNVAGASKNSVIKTASTFNSSIYLSSSSQKLSSVPTSVNVTKPSILKNTNRSHNDQQSTTSSGNQSHSYKAAVSTSGNSSKRQPYSAAVTTTHSLHQPYTESTSTLISTIVQSSPVSSVASSVSNVTPSSNTIVEEEKKTDYSANMANSSQPATVSELSVSYTSAVVSGADGKTKGISPSARGRKNSLSAIVDKLKHNAAGSGLDLIAPAPQKPSVNQLLGTKETDVETQDTDLPSDAEKLLSVIDSNHLKSQLLHSASKSIPHGNLDPSNSTSSSSESPPVTSTGKRISSNSLNPIDKRDEISMCNREESGKDNSIDDNKASSDIVKHRPKPLNISFPSVVSPCSSPFPSQRSSSPSIAIPKSNGESLTPSRVKDKVFKIPSMKDLEERTSSPDLGKSSDSNRINKWSDKNVDSPLQASPFPGSNTSNKTFPRSDRKMTKSVESPLSDISSPDNDLVIDDESLKSSSKFFNSKNNQLNLSKNSGSSPIPKSVNLSNVKSDKGETTRSTPHVGGEKMLPSSPLVGNLEGGIVCSPQTSGRPPSALSAKSPAYSRTQSGASTPKGSDSPFEIDDDLMDVALGCDS